MKRPESPAWRITSRPIIGRRRPRRWPPWGLTIAGGSAGVKATLLSYDCERAHYALRSPRDLVPDRPGPHGGHHHAGPGGRGERGRGPRVIRPRLHRRGRNARGRGVGAG